MAVIKSWSKEAHGIKYHPVSLAYVEETQTLKWSRSYYFVDEIGNQISGGLVEDNLAVRGEMAWADVPQNVKDALITIDTFTKNEINKKENI